MNNTASTVEKKNNTPILIIGVVLVAALVGGFLYFSSTKPVTNTNTGVKSSTGNSPKPTVNTANAPAGATPPNQQGSPTAAVTLEEFADFQCPQCGATHPIMNEIKSLYGSRIHFIFRDYPLSIPAHDKSYDAAVSAEAAGMQGKFWDMQNMLFTNQRTWTADPNFKQIWKDYAQKIGLDVPKWENDAISLAAKSRVDQDIARAKGLNINSTPTLYINGVDVPFQQMTVDGLKQLIDAELAKTSGQKPADAAPAPANAAPANAANTKK